MDIHRFFDLTHFMTFGVCLLEGFLWDSGRRRQDNLGVTVVTARSAWTLLQAAQKTPLIIHWPNPVDARFLCGLETSKGTGIISNDYFPLQSSTSLLLGTGVMRRLRRSPVGLDLG